MTKEERYRVIADLMARRRRSAAMRESWERRRAQLAEFVEEEDAPGRADADLEELPDLIVSG